MGLLDIFKFKRKDSVPEKATTCEKNGFCCEYGERNP